MASGSYKQSDVLCPYYKSDDGAKSITCCGLVDRASIKLIYTVGDDYKRQMSVFCCKHYRHCEIYQALDSIYREQ